MAIAEIHKEIIQTRILTRLDGQTLSAAACVSSQLRSLCSDDQLWSDICSSNWPSTDHPLVRQAISNFPSGHRSFFSDSFPSPSHRLTTTTTTAPPQIVSAVDLWYHGELVFSKVESTDTAPDSEWFRSAPFRIDLLEPKEIVPSEVKFSGDDREMQSDLEKNITLSWIVIDPTGNRAVNVSSVEPVSVQRNWLTDDIELTFAVVAIRDDGHHDEEHVSCNIEVTCGVKEGSGEVYVSGVGLTVQDLDGKCLSGEGSMVILQGLTASQRRSRRYDGGGGVDQKERYEEFVERGKKRKEERERRERRLDMVCVASGMAFLMAFWSFALW